MDTLVSVERRFFTESFTRDSSLWAVHQAVVQREYRRLGFITDHDCPGGVLCDAYDNQDALYFLVRDIETDAVVGTFRMIRPLPRRGLHFHEVYPEYMVRQETITCEPTRVVSLLQHDASYGRQTVLFEVFLQSVVYARTEGLSHVVSLGTRAILRWINATFGSVQRAIGPARPLPGGSVIPCIVDVYAFERRLQEERPSIWHYYQGLFEEALA